MRNWRYQRWMRKLRRMDHYDLIQLMQELNRELARRRQAEHHALENE